MDEVEKNNRLLAPYRVLDLTNEKGFLCGKILGDLGADVIKIEKPGGDPSRNIEPFYHDVPDPQRSLYWFAYNANKRGITLDIEIPAGQQIFKRLVERADAIIESFLPGYMGGLSLGYSALNQIQPKLVMTSITPFGQTGPYSDHQASDLTAMAMGGITYLCGDSDRPPVRISFPQAYLHAGAEAAVGTMVALYDAGTTGKGQHVDISIQHAMICTLLQAPLVWHINKVNVKRSGPCRAATSMGGACPQAIFPCKDGHVTFFIYGGQAGLHTNSTLVKWMGEEGMAPASLKTRDWEALDMSTITEEEVNQILKPIAEFFLTHTKQELYQGALRRRIMLFPVNTTKDLMEDHQLEARHFWQPVEHPELGTTIMYPEGFARLTETDCTIWRRAPLTGEHNEEIYEKELGLSREQLKLLKETKVI